MVVKMTLVRFRGQITNFGDVVLAYVSECASCLLPGQYC